MLSRIVSGYGVILRSASACKVWNNARIPTLQGEVWKLLRAG
jgi:hypothetical protein